VTKNFGYIICESSAKEVKFNIVGQSRNNFVFAEGVLQEAEEQNRNKRCYGREDLYNEIYSPKQRELVSSGNFKGEAGHPSACDLARQQKIDPNLEQVWYTKLWMDDNLVKSVFRGTNNDLGRSFNDDLLDGQKPSFSLRALGSIVQEGGKAYVRNIKIITYDRVYFPSHTKAYTTKLLTESTCMQGDKYIYVPKRVLEAGNQMIVDESFQIITPITNESMRSYIMAESTNLATAMKNFDTFFESVKVSEDGTHVTIVDKNYETLYFPLEQHIQNEIMNFCDKIR